MSTSSLEALESASDSEAPPQQATEQITIGSYNFDAADWQYRSRPKGDFALFPDGAPGELSKARQKNVEGYGSNLRRPLKLYTTVNCPELTPYFATTTSSDEDVVGAPAVVILPGGGFVLSAYEGEGTAIAERFAKRGVHAFVLKYRVPQREARPAMPEHWAALQDAQRAVTVVRASAPFWGIHPLKIGVVGFSAGGTLAALLSTHYKAPLYPAVDYADLVSPRPDFAVFIYPGDLLESSHAAGDATEEAEQHANPKLLEELRVDGETPPAFLAHAADDRIQTFANSVAYFNALANAGVGPLSELQIFGQGNHGFETNTVCTSAGTPYDAYYAIPPICDWLDSALEWMNRTLFLFEVAPPASIPNANAADAAGTDEEDSSWWSSSSSSS